MRKLVVVGLYGDRSASQFDRLVIILQPEIGLRLLAIPKIERRIVRARPNRLVERFKAFLELPEEYVGGAQAAGGRRNGRVQGECALVLRDGLLGAPLELKGDPSFT